MPRIRHRYVFLRAFPEDVVLDKSDVWRAIQSSLQYLVGALGYADVNPYLVRMQKNWIVIRCNSEHVRKLIAAVALIKDVGGKNLSLDVLKVSGTLRALLRKIKH